ncbi:flagellar cap protein FliD [Clostridium botulinum]|uniref:flagellar filament capping protein FliD n=1 Tax=Clostridium botulinum TaxID=1491 RepID=UPI0013FF98EC|nr:flagellar filament capping protein FliD [Clostridium botulinum]MBN1073444.1 flagellar cap protein FliD [Clostridium botulinum]NFN14808.1 flagellar cap protein FliD [Clostridium botulinum]
MRITGMATGLDMDEIIKNSMKPYRIKVDQMTQKKDVVEIKQKLYRDIMSDASKFYDKYFDLTKSDSLLKSSNYKSVSFTSSSDAVKVTAGSGAKPGNYTVTGSAATAAKATITDTNQIKDGGKIVVNGKEFTLEGKTTKDREKDLNNKLKEAGINVTARFSDFAGTDSGNQSGLILESTVLGKNGTFTMGGTTGTIGTSLTEGKDATAIAEFTMQDMKDSKKIIIDGKDIDLTDVFKDDTLTDSDRIDVINEKLKAENIKLSINGSNEIIVSSTKTDMETTMPSVSANGKGLDSSTIMLGTKAEMKIDNSEISSSSTIVINGKAIEVPKTGTDEEKQKYLNNIFKQNSLGLEATVDSTGIKIKSTSAGANGNFELNSLSGGTVGSGGTDSTIKIVDDKGGVYKLDGTSNTVTLDGITFTFNGKIDGEVKITGKNDVTETKDKLVNFINDYNTLMEKLNTLTMTRHDKGYDPLTAEQKKEMSENEIKLWNERVEKGQLYKDTDLARITNSLKSTMRTVMDGTGLNLEKIGIKPIKDYTGTKNGTFTIDESKLTAALEEDVEGVMNLFIGKPEEGDKTTPEYTSKTGILHQLNDTLKQEFKTSSSSLSKKAGVEGTSTFTNNELTKSMSNYEKKIKDMEKSFARREQQLYSKYATLEKMMNKLNSQQSNLMSQLGMS